MILFVISCVFSLTSFLCPQVIHSPLARSHPEVVRSQVFTHLRLLKERSTVQVVEGKVKAINNLSRTAGKN